MRHTTTLIVIATLAILASTARAQVPEVIYSEIVSSDTSLVPGAVNLSGAPVAARFTVLADLHLSPDGTQWIIKATTDQPDTERNVMLLGGDAVGSVFAQEGQPVAAGVGAEVYDFFDGVAGFNSLNQFAFGARARGGDPAVFEKIIVFDGVDYEIRIQMGDACLGVMDLAPAPTGDETFGNSLNSIHMLDSGAVGFVAVTMDNIHSSRRPAIFYDDTAFLQTGVSPIAGEIWDSFDSNDFRTSLDGNHYAVQGDTENPDTDFDDILVVDGAVVVQEGQTVGGGITADAIFHTKLFANGDWVARGDDPGSADWVLQNGVLIAATGFPLFFGSPEAWADIIVLASQTPSGDIMIAGNTNNADPNMDSVLVIGETVVLRENDPIDLDGDGLANDDAFLNIFHADDASVTPNGDLYLLCGLRDSVGTVLGDAFVRVSLGVPPTATEFIRGDANQDGMLDIADPVFALDLLFGAGGTTTCVDDKDTNDDGGFDISDPIYALSNLFSAGPPPPAPYPNCGVDPTPDGIDCTSFDACP